MRPEVWTSGAARAGRRGLLLGLLVALAAPFAFADQVEPLEVPRGPGPAAEAHAELAPAERIEKAVKALEERGYAEQPLMAWALLEVAAKEPRPELVERALELAPSSPGLHVQAALEHGRMGALFGSVRALAHNLPALAWCLAMLWAALGLGVLIASVLLAVLVLVRTLSLHGHALGHMLRTGDAASGPAALAVLALLACVPLFGLGPGIQVALCGALAALGAARGLAGTMLGFLAASSLLIGPGLEYGARIATALNATSPLLAAWRVDFSEPLPGDEAKLEQAFARAPDDAFYSLSLANALKHRGETARAEKLLADAPPAASAVVEARTANLLGIVRLARGDASAAVTQFERARSYGETATVLYNLSQVYARRVELMRREELYTEARNRDAELVSQYAALEGANVHSYVIQEPLPASLYIGRMLSPTPEASALARSLRRLWLGSALPAWGWLLLPLLGVAGLPFRRSGLARCRRCDRAVCRRCSPVAGAGPTCPRCEGLFGTRAKTDARLRRQEQERDRLRQLWMRRMRAAAGLVLPGLGSLLEERMLAGMLRVGVLAFALGLALAGDALPAPFEMRPITGVSPWLGAALIGVLYALELRGLRGLFSGSRA